MLKSCVIGLGFEITQKELFLWSCEFELFPHRSPCTKRIVRCTIISSHRNRINRKLEMFAPIPLQNGYTTPGVAGLKMYSQNEILYIWPLTWDVKVCLPSWCPFLLPGVEKDRFPRRWNLSLRLCLLFKKPESEFYSLKHFQFKYVAVNRWIHSGIT